MSVVFCVLCKIHGFREPGEGEQKKDTFVNEILWVGRKKMCMGESWEKRR